MILPYVLAGMCAISLTLLIRSPRLTNLLSAVHALATLFLSFNILVNEQLPQYYPQNQYFFIDKLGLYSAIIASAIFFLAAIYASGYETQSLIRQGRLSLRNFKLFYMAFNLLLTMTILAFFSNNLALFWIFAELTTLFSAILVVTRNAKGNIDAALKYIFIASASMLFTFVGLILLFALTKQVFGTGTLNWNLLVQQAYLLPSPLISVIFGLILIGFAAKAGIAPFHTWLPHAHSKSPSAISAILSSAILNIGLYGFLRISTVMRQTGAASLVSHTLIFFGVLSIAIASLSMLQQRNLKKLIAFSSVENMGLMLLGIGIGTPVALFWVLFHMLGHSLAKALLFFSAGILHRQYESNDYSEMVNALKLQPLAAFGLITGSIAVIGMPPFALFLSKFYILSQAETLSPFLLGGILLLLLIAAAAFLIILMRIFQNTSPEAIRKNQITIGMKLPIIALAAAILMLGLFVPAQLHHLLSEIAAIIGGV